MNIKHKPWGLYVHNPQRHKDKVWERKSSYVTFDDAMQALRQMGKKEGEYKVILPNKSAQYRYIQVEEHENLKKVAR
jgi:hypothetical protein